MNHLCEHCSEHLDPAWVFCPRCAKRVEHAAAPAHPEPEKLPVTGAFSGLYMGLILAPVLLIVGGMLCCTGLGAILGIPMIVAGIVSPLAGPLFGMGAAKGKVL